MHPEKKTDLTNQQLIDSSDYLGPAVSSTDCTGLIPSGPTDQSEREAYEEILSYTPVSHAKAARGTRSPDR